MYYYHLIGFRCCLSIRLVNHTLPVTILKMSQILYFNNILNNHLCSWVMCLCYFIVKILLYEAVHV